MRSLSLFLGATCLASLSAWAQTAPEASTSASASTPPASAAAARPPVAPEKLQAMRSALLARIAVYDAVEKSYRAPTPAEHAALASARVAASTPRAVSLANGGTALKADAAEMSFLTVDLQADGKPAIRHALSARDQAEAAAPSAKPATAARATSEGGRDAR